MLCIRLLFLLLLAISCYGKTLTIDEKSTYQDLLSYASIYIDKSRALTIEDIKNKKITFEANKQSILSFGYSPNFDVWVRLTLKNSSDKTINRIIEYGNVLTTHIEFYSPDTNYKTLKDGLFTIDRNRKTIKPIFKIQLKPQEEKTYYIKASSYILALIIKLNLWENEAYFTEELQHQFYLALFFGAMFILALYNLFIYFYTKDISYLFYVLYIFGVIFHHLIFVGIGNIYLFNQTWIIYNVKLASLIVALPIVSLALFTKTFLRTKQYPIFDKILNIFLLLMPISIIVFLATDDFNKYRNIISLLLIVYLMILTIYATIKRNRQAYFVLFGEVIIAMSFALMYLSSIGVINLYKLFPYFIEFALVLEAIIFSIALADRIKQLQKEKNDVSNKLIIQQHNEKERLATQVSEKTKDLEVALDEKGLLLKELNHRVKNNMQTIVSLIRLQSDEIEDEKIQSTFLTIQNRINAMSHLHELLYRQDSVAYVNAFEYFDRLIAELLESYDNEIDIQLDIQTELKMEQAIYCGLILNELITNSLKYGFPNKKGEILVELTKEQETYCLQISDNGIGYENKNEASSLGLVLVNTLAKKQLQGSIDMETDNGVSVTIKWGK